MNPNLITVVWTDLTKEGTSALASNAAPDGEVDPRCFLPLGQCSHDDGGGEDLGGGGRDGRQVGGGGGR